MSSRLAPCYSCPALSCSVDVWVATTVQNPIAHCIVVSFFAEVECKVTVPKQPNEGRKKKKIVALFGEPEEWEDLSVVFGGGSRRPT